MNFYSDFIRDEIVENSDLEIMMDELDSFQSQYEYLILKYSMYTINHRYTMNILKDSDNIVIAFYCLDQEFEISNCPSILIYSKYLCEDEIHYYVLFTCTKRSFRGQGYASRLMDGFLDRVSEENRESNKKVKVILSSLETSVLFYEGYGFKWTRKCISEYPILLKYEGYEKNKEYFMMELNIQ